MVRIALSRAHPLSLPPPLALMQPEINFLAAVLAAVSAFLLGGLWYSPALFGNAWLKATGLTQEELAKSNPAVVYGVAFVFAVIAAVVFALFLGPAPAPGFAVGAGAAAGACWVGASFGINYMFERKPVSLLLINAGYHTAQFTLYGLILGLWH